MFTTNRELIIKHGLLKCPDPASTFIKRQCYFITFVRPWKWIVDTIYLNKTLYIYLRFACLVLAWQRSFYYTLYPAWKCTLQTWTEVQLPMHQQHLHKPLQQLQGNTYEYWFNPWVIVKLGPCKDFLIFSNKNKCINVTSVQCQFVLLCAQECKCKLLRKRRELIFIIGRMCNYIFSHFICTNKTTPHT